jgi:hypothetical protein
MSEKPTYTQEDYWDLAGAAHQQIHDKHGEFGGPDHQGFITPDYISNPSARASFETARHKEAISRRTELQDAILSETDRRIQDSETTPYKSGYANWLRSHILSAREKNKKAENLLPPEYEKQFEFSYASYRGFAERLKDARADINIIPEERARKAVQESLAAFEIDGTDDWMNDQKRAGVEFLITFVPNGVDRYSLNKVLVHPTDYLNDETLDRHSNADLFGGKSAEGFRVVFMPKQPNVEAGTSSEHMDSLKRDQSRAKSVVEPNILDGLFFRAVQRATGEPYLMGRLRQSNLPIHHLYYPEDEIDEYYVPGFRDTSGLENESARVDSDSNYDQEFYLDAQVSSWSLPAYRAAAKVF